MSRIARVLCFLSILPAVMSHARTWYILPDGTGDAATSAGRSGQSSRRIGTPSEIAGAVLAAVVATAEGSVAGGAGALAVVATTVLVVT